MTQAAAQAEGRRAERKARTHRRLVEVAGQLFRARGFEATRMEEIAAEAGIAVGTCYNYFEGKGDLLLALVVQADESCIVAAEPLLADLPQDPEEALVTLALHDSRHSLAALDKAGWRQVLAQTMAQPDSAFARAYAETTEALKGLFVRAFAILQARGQVRPDVAPQEAADLVFAAKYMRFIDHVADDGADFARHAAEVRAAIRLCLRGLAAAPGPAPGQG
ncbi:MAG: TetR/AcrR family transcriptional regulator [Rhodobacteraceae bacterium]|nr:TetR/AcrR family transcriptional regulator [Paracoccaceae bacterium]